MDRLCKIGLLVQIFALFVIGINALNSGRSNRVKRVIGGVTLEGNEFPWLVSLQGKIPDKTFLGIPLSRQKFYCGGSLISNRWVLTAAHCFPVHDSKVGSRALIPRYWHVRIGELELRRNTVERIRDAIGKIFKNRDLRHYYMHALKIIIHPEYNKQEQWKNDVALIKLEEDVPLSSPDSDDDDDDRSIQAVDLASNASFPEDGQLCVMKGWGCITNGGGVASYAHQVALPKVEDSYCRDLWAVNTESRLCAGNTGTDSTEGICSGDSGGPLVCRNSSGDWLQVGVASFTSATRPHQVPAVFARVSYYRDWIQSVMAVE